MHSSPGAFSYIAELPAREVMPGTTVQTLTGDGLQLVRTTLAPGSVFPAHNHSHEQFIVVLEGILEFTIGEDTRSLGPGGVFYMAPDVPHGARVLSSGPVVLLEIFHPVRVDYLETTEEVSHAAPR